MRLAWTGVNPVIKARPADAQVMRIIWAAVVRGDEKGMYYARERLSYRSWPALIGGQPVPHSVRVRPGAPVAVPIHWDELDRMKDAHPFSIEHFETLLKRSAGLKGWRFATQGLPEI